MSDFLDMLPRAMRLCLMSQSAALLARVSPEGRACSRAMNQWKEMVAVKKEAAEKRKLTLKKMSPTHRAMGKGLRAWHEFATTRRRRMAAIQSALKRLTPEGRALYAGWQGFRARAPTWTEGPGRFLSPDGFWVTSLKSKERESVVGTPEVRARAPTRMR